MKKLLLKLGALTTIVAPILSVIACSSNEKASIATDISENTNGIGNHAQINNETVNQKLVTMAALKNILENTDHDFLRVGGPGMTIFQEGIVKLEDYDKWADFNNVFAECRPGDYIDFVFDDKNDISQFTKRVFYDNTLNPKNNLLPKDIEFDTIHFNMYEIKEDEVVAGSDLVGKFGTQGVSGEKRLFTLTTPKQNVVRMTFNDIYENSGQHIEAQLLYLRGFEDSNEDGQIDLEDIQMTPTFALDNDAMYGAYVQTGKSTKNYWNTEYSVGVHDLTIAKYLTNLYD